MGFEKRFFTKKNKEVRVTWATCRCRNGAGGSSDHLELQVIVPDRKYGVLVQRIEANKDYFILNYTQDIKRHDQEYSLGLYYLHTFSRVELNFQSTVGRTLNRYYAGDVSNLTFSMGLRYLLN